MSTVTFRVLEGIDKGRVFRDLPTPVTIGREEGNLLRLNDERVSRYHAKVQCDNGEVILTDLESTNGTRVNNVVIQIRRLRPGDRVNIGRSQLLFGSDEEISDRISAFKSQAASGSENKVDPVPPTVHACNLASQLDSDQHLTLSPRDKVTEVDGALYLGQRALPPLPLKMSPAQAARLAELLDFMHLHLTQATDQHQANEEGSQIMLSFQDWQQIQGVQMLLARYVRAISEPDALGE